MQEYTTIAGMLRLLEQHLSQRDIAARYKIGKGTVARILEKAKKMNITYSDIKDTDPDDVIEKFYSTRLSKSSKPLFRENLSEITCEEFKVQFNVSLERVQG